MNLGGMYMTLVIMAAGMGSRFGGLKQIEPMNDNGEFIIDYSIYDAIKSGFNKVVFIIKKENYDIFKETIGKRIENQIKVEYIFQELDKLPEGFECPNDRVKPWGTAHAILCAKDAVNEPFMVINADDFYGRESFAIGTDFMKNINEKSNKMKSAIVGYKLLNTVTENGSVKRGICEVKDGKLVKITECKVEKEGEKHIAYPVNGKDNFETNEDTIVSMNMIVFSNKIFKYLEEYFVEFLKENINNNTSEFQIPAVILDLMNRQLLEVEVLKTNAKWLGVTYKEDKENVVTELKKLHNEKIYTEKLWNLK